MKWNEGQEKAISSCWLDADRTKRCNLLVNAAAGSGKTAVLVERIIRKITPDEDGYAENIDSLLVVTFTTAAAAEMQQKINRAITAKMNELRNDAVRYKRMKQQLKLLSVADICNIDSYCLRMVRNNFHLLGVDPGFSPATGPEIELLKEQGMEELFDELYDGEEPFCERFRVLAEKYSDDYSDKTLTELVGDIYRHIMSMPEPEQWLDDKLDQFRCEDILSSRWAKLLCPETHGEPEAVSRAVSGMRVLITHMIAVTQDIPLHDAAESVDNCLEHGEVMTRHWGNAWKVITDDYCALCAMRDKTESGPFSWGRFPTSADKVKGISLTDEDIPIADFTDQFARIRQMRENIKTDYKENQEYELDTEKEQYIAETLYADLTVICELTKRYIRKMQDIKDKRGILEFNDIERLVYRLLRDNSDIRRGYREKYGEILIDEYQDINALQEAIFQELSNGTNLFMVGDMKQSIYRFRNADPTIFKHKLDTYRGGENQTVALNRNYRSREIVLEGINEVFETVMSETTGEINYNDDQRLYAGDKAYEDVNRQIGGANLCEVYIIPTDTGNEGEADEDLSAAEKEAELIARKIAQMKRDHFRIRYQQADGTFGYREIKNSDIAILRRSVKKVADIYTEALKRHQVDCYVETSGYFDRKEVKVVLSLIKAISNPLCDIPLIALMRSYIFCFRDEELARIRMYGGETYYACVQQAAEQVGGLGEKCTYFLQCLSRWRRYAKYMSSDKLIWTLYEETDFYSIAGTWADGEDAQANLRLLFERAKAYEDTGFKGLFHFIQYMDKIAQKEGEDLSAAKLISDSHDVVKMMTMHKSKGLEFPVVFLSGTLGGFSHQDEKKKIALHRDLGFGLKYIDSDERSIAENITYDAVRKVNRMESLSESMRLLYVAMTRAKEKLILVGAEQKTGGGIAKREAKWDLMYYGDAVSKARDASKASCFMDWVAPIARRSNLWLYHTVPYTQDKICEDEQLPREERQEEEQTVNLDYRYPYQGCTVIPSKISVTEIKTHSVPDAYPQEETEQAVFFWDQPHKTEVITRPKFLSEKRLTGAQIGTAAHYVMQTLTEELDMTEDKIKAHIFALTEAGKLTETEASAVNVAKIMAFYDTKLGQRLTRSRAVYKERPFEILVPVRDIYPEIEDACGREEIVVQGIIDCFFEEDGQWILLDYKTDSYARTQAGLDGLRAKYAPQLSWYARALETVTKKSVKEKYLYLFSGSDVVQC